MKGVTISALSAPLPRKSTPSPILSIELEMAPSQQSAEAAAMTMTKFWHAMIGLYLWEFFTTLGYEWKVFRGELPYRWTIWIYSWARVASLVGVALLLATLDTTTQINCQHLILFTSIFFCSSATASSLLIVLRTIAIWNRNKVVVALTLILWLTSIGFHLHYILGVNLSWDPTLGGCVGYKIIPTTLSFVPALVVDMFLFSIILAGLIVLRRGGVGTFGLAHVLWTQGLIWLVLGILADVPELVFALLHSNDQWNAMFEVPSVIIMTIAVTRMHRSLVNFASGQSEVSAPPDTLLLTKTKPSTALDRIEVVVDTTFEQHPKGTKNETRSDDSSSIYIRTKPTYPPHPSPIPQKQLEGV